MISIVTLSECNLTMKLLHLLTATGVSAQQIAMTVPENPDTSTMPFSSRFHQPQPPLIQPEFKANWNQHKWSVESFWRWDITD